MTVTPGESRVGANRVSFEPKSYREQTLQRFTRLSFKYERSSLITGVELCAKRTNLPN